MRTLSLLLVICAVSGCGSATSPEKPAVVDKLEKVPLDTVFSAGFQKGLKLLPSGGNDARNIENGRFRHEGVKPRVSNIFLTHGDDEKEAYANALHFREPTDHLLIEVPKTKLWLAVFLGRAPVAQPGDPPFWTLDSIEHGPSKWRASYSATRKWDKGNRNIQAFFYLAPFGRSAVDILDLELFDSDAKGVVLRRQVRAR